MAWSDLSLEAVIAAARADRMQLIVRNPPDSELALYAGDPCILGWDVDHEPSLAPPDEQADVRLAAFKQRREAIRNQDPGRPVFTVNSPSISPPRTDLWVAWSQAGDVVAFWKYPFFRPQAMSLSGPRGIPEVISLAVSANGEEKPVWYVAQAFESTIRDWYMPTPREARAMAYAALIHGATGIIWFCFDSYVSRNGDVLGAAPRPEADYGIVDLRPPERGPPLTASVEQVDRSQRMWRTVKALNREIAELRTLILSPTSTREYRVFVQGRTESTTPIRTLLKREDERFVLLMVNLDNVPLDVRFDFGAAVRDMEVMFEHEAAPAIWGAGWQERLEPFDVRVYRFVM